MINERSASRNPTIPIIIAALIIIIYFPALRWMLNSWFASDYYTHGFLVPLVSGFFIWTKREHFRNREPSAIGIVWLVLGAALYVASFLLQVRSLGVVSLLCVITGLIFSIYGIRTVKALLFPLVFLIFMVPFWFIDDLAYQLQYLSVQLSSVITVLMGLPVQTSGAEIHLGNMSFFVGVACSGINSLVALLALAAVYAYILEGTQTRRLTLFAMAIPLAIGANILRIASVILVAYFVNQRIATGWYHDLASPIFFFLAFGGLIMISRLLQLKFNYKTLSI